MQPDVPTPPSSPEPCLLLIESLPGKVLLAFIKKDAQLTHTVFLGFSARERSLLQPVVRQRLERELTKNSQLADDLFGLWSQLFAPLMARLDAPDFSPTPETLAPLRREFGAATLRYALLHAARDETRLWVDRLDDLPAKTPSPIAPDHQRPSKAVHTREEKASVHAGQLAQECATLRAEVIQLKRQLAESGTQLAATQKQLDDTERRASREQRRAKKAEEEGERLRKALKEKKTAPQLPPAQPPAPQAPAELLDSVTEAIALLQRGLSSILPEQTAAAEGKVALPPKVVPPERVPRKILPAAASISLPGPRGAQTYTTVQILAGLLKNDEKLLARIRDGIAFLAGQPERERVVIAELTKAGIPDTLLTGPLRAAVIDGSNAANLQDDQPGAQLAYLRQLRHAAWREGYFPVITIVDASLRHQIDRPDQLMEMIARGEIIMAPAGTSADEMLIEETAHRRAVLITNDRMTDWPAAKDLEKRHIELIGGNASVGQFHRSSIFWFR